MSQEDNKVVNLNEKRVEDSKDIELILPTDRHRFVWESINKDKNDDALGYVNSVLSQLLYSGLEGDERADYINGLLHSSVASTHDWGSLTGTILLTAIHERDGKEALDKVLSEFVLVDVLLTTGSALYNIVENMEFVAINRKYYFGNAEEEDLVHINQLYKGLLNQYVLHRVSGIMGVEVPNAPKPPFTEDEREVLDEYLGVIARILYTPTLSNVMYDSDVEEKVVTILSNHYKD